MPYLDEYSDTYELDQRFKPFPTLPTVVWAIDGHEVLVDNDWVGTADERGGFEDALIRALNSGRLKGDIREGPIKATEWDSSETVWEGTVVGEPRYVGDTLEISGAGKQSLLVAKETPRNFMTRDLSIWRDAHDQPHGFVATDDTDEIEASIEPAGFLFRLEVGETQSNGARHLLAAWTPGTSITSLAYEYRKKWNNGSHDLRTIPFTGSQGPLGTPIDVRMDTGAAAPTWHPIDQTIPSPENAVAFGLYINTGDTWATKQIIRVNNIRVRGIATSDFMNASSVVANLGAAVGLHTSRVEDFLNDIMPLYIQGPWAETLDYIATITDRHWGVYDGDNLEYGDYSTQWSTAEESGASVNHCKAIKPASTVLVTYPDLSGNELFYEIVVSPNPNESEGISPQAVIGIDQRQHTEGIANSVANWNIEYLTAPGWEIDALVTSVSRDGVPASPYQIRPGGELTIRDCGPHGTVKERIRGTRYTSAGTEVSCNLSMNIAEELEEMMDIKRQARHKKPRVRRRPRRPRIPRR